MKIAKWINAVVGILLLAGCAGYAPPKKTLQPELVTPYLLDSGDQVRVVVFGQTDLSNTYGVDKAGMISMPLIGFVPARGQTTSQVEATITAKLRAGYVRNPDVSVEVDRYRPFYAMGEINAAGQYAYVAGMTVQAAVAAAGGFTPRADKNSVTVTRSFNGRVETERLALSDPIMPGDTLYVRERLF
jgi:polysaccharide export outer membrane protein